ncbi:hypothetical protein PO498_23875 [Klebsiella variicola]|uniref:hypothetical protein n=1 Tax=Klebsiella variicola TaxID=244366 RepID=UPI0012B9439D|nr:hypothetical protein [Klebsiella variicola]MBY5172958.1 hypothetical protein [Klebsiella variicola]
MRLKPIFERGASPALRLSADQEARFSSLCHYLQRRLGAGVDITPQAERTGAQSALTLRLVGYNGRRVTLRLCVSGFVRWPVLPADSDAPLVVHAMDAADVMALAAELHRRLQHPLSH